MTQLVICDQPLRSILIHTSVKLVTVCQAGLSRSEVHFNPHEREARDVV